MEDEAIIRLFFERSEQAVAQLDVKYGRLLRSLAGNILNNQQDAEESVNDAYLAAWNTIPPRKPNPLGAYLCKIVRNLSLKLRRSRLAAKRNSSYDLAMEELDGCLADSRTVEGEIESRELARIIQDFLDTLSQENRVIFMRRYWFGDPYAQIARQVGLTETNASVRLTRIRRALKDYLTEREFFV